MAGAPNHHSLLTAHLDPDRLLLLRLSALAEAMVDGEVNEAPETGFIEAWARQVRGGCLGVSAVKEKLFIAIRLVTGHVAVEHLLVFVHAVRIEVPGAGEGGAVELEIPR